MDNEDDSVSIEMVTAAVSRSRLNGEGGSVTIAMIGWLWLSLCNRFFNCMYILIFGVRLQLEEESG